MERFCIVQPCAGKDVRIDPVEPVKGLLLHTAIHHEVRDEHIVEQAVLCLTDKNGLKHGVRRRIDVQVDPIIDLPFGTISCDGRPQVDQPVILLSGLKSCIERSIRAIVVVLEIINSFSFRE